MRIPLPRMRITEGSGNQTSARHDAYAYSYNSINKIYNSYEYVQKHVTFFNKLGEARFKKNCAQDGCVVDQNLLEL